MNCGLHENSSAWARHRDRLTKAVGRTSCIDHPFVGGLRQFLSHDDGVHACATGNPKLLFVSPIEMDPFPPRIQNLCDEESQLAVAQDGDIGIIWNRGLVENLAGGCEGLDEHSFFRRDGIRKDVKIHFRKSQQLPECAGMANNAEHSPLRAMAPESFSAPFALTAGEIDFPNNTAPDKTWRIGLDDFTDEFVSRRSAKPVVSPLKFQVRVADAGTQQADQRKSRGSRRLPRVSDGYPALLEMDRKHACTIRKMATLLHNLGQIDGAYPLNDI
jgi:hypothetical protein